MDDWDAGSFKFGSCSASSRRSRLEEELSAGAALHRCHSHHAASCDEVG